MLDCGLDLSPVLNFMPIPLVHSTKLSQLTRVTSKEKQLDGEIRESSLQNRFFIDSEPEFGPPDQGVVDFSQIDAILVSNYMTLLSLPYITEETGFRGAIYMTEPTLHFGRLFMEETIEFLEQCSPRSSKNESSSMPVWKSYSHFLPGNLQNISSACKTWRKIYSRSQIEASLSKVTLCGFSEQKDIFGLVKVSPVSSGFCIGSSNWLINSGFEKIAYISGSSTLTTHPSSLDQSPLRNTDCLIMTALTQTPTQNPDPMIVEFCKTVIETAKSGGNVLVPCYPAGIVYDLIECLAGQMEINSLSTVPMYFVSPVADSSLAYSNIMAEWLSGGKKSRVYIPEEPFPHGNLVKCGRLKSFKNLYDGDFSTEYRQPCVMFAGHPSLRFGEAIHFLELWGNNSNNTIVFTEPSFPYLDALAPFQPLQMRTVNCPIDTSLNFSQAKKLVRDLKPGMIATPKCYTSPPASASQRTDLQLELGDTPVYTFSRDESLQIPLHSKLERITIEPTLATKLKPVEVKPGVSLATMTGELNVSNNKYHLDNFDDENESKQGGGPAKRQRKEVSPSMIKSGKDNYPSQYLFGKISISNLLQSLQSQGIATDKVEEPGPGNFIIHLEKEEALIRIEDQETHVVCEDIKGSNIREKIRQCIVSCLNTF